MKRRSVIAAGAMAALAGCSAIGGSSGISTSLDTNSNDPQDFFSGSMSASEGDEVQITIEAGSEGAEIGFIPEEASVDSGDMMGGHQIGWDWSVDAGETETETITIDEDDSYVFMIVQGSADVSAE